MSSEIVTYNRTPLVVKTERDLPRHLTFEQYQDIYYKLEGMDQFLCGVMFETGARVSDVVNLRWNDVDTNRMTINMFVDKRDINITIPISEPLNNDFKKILSWVKPSKTDYIFNTRKAGPNSGSGHLTRSGVSLKVSKWGEMIGIKLHPHMFRHGLAIYLLSQGVNIKVIAARLGHANVFTTMNYYLVITPEIQRECLEGIPMR